ncbi:hypothetical protein BIV57_01295 [Mangrovactinospora gilvigrisea]|uniref:Sugar ABC transporter substrate-binding protein n=1 Tax=Mangrovactinospora gilvigrisea TaxID=1428644 RepID=A0A1J7BLF2_9ACTN|nr:hypothetical protein BIV57_01295 [Mangrovactinospora gilvigrisea]
MAGAGATALAGALSACSGSTLGADKGSAAKSAKLTLPAYAKETLAKPDLSAPGTDPAYLRYPSTTPRSTKGTPGDGKKINAITSTWSLMPPGMASNSYWQELNKRLGSVLAMDVVNGNLGDGYAGKLEALIAAGDLGDMVWIPTNGGALSKPLQLMQAKFHDLTGYLSGDAVKDFPNLANLPTYSWKSAVMGGALYGPVVTYGRLGQVYVVNSKFWEPVGGIAFSSAQDFLDKGKDLLDAKRKKYVLEPAYVNHVHMFAEWHGATSGWRTHNGKLQHMFEQPEYAAAIEFGAKVFKANLFWPDANVADAIDKVAGGQQLGAYVQSYPGYRVDLQTQPFTLDVIVPFAATPGAKPVFDMGTGALGFTAIPTTVPKARIKTLLNVLDYLAAPFGSEERKFLDNGIEGRHYTMGLGGAIRPTALGKAEAVTTAQPVATLCQGPEYLYVPGNDTALRLAFATQKKLLAIAQTSASLGYYSDTALSKNASLTTTMYDLVSDIVSGRKPMSAWAPAVKQWRSGGGDAMRHEYGDAIAKG